MGCAAGAAAGVAAAIANAVKASGAIVQVEPEDFIKALALEDKPVVVHALGGVINKHHRYIAGVRGLAFYTKSDRPLEFLTSVHLFAARKIWIPD